jgi:integrase
MWQKKIRGKIHYFGRWGHVRNGKMERVEGDGWKEALEAYKAVADDLHAGRTPRVKGDGLTVAGLCNAFLTAKTRKVSSGELSSRSLMEYREITDKLVAIFGKDRLVDDLAADDFEALRADLAERWGPVRLGNGITRVKSVFKYGLDNGLIEKPVRYGGEFRKPDKAVLRRHRAQNGGKMLEADQLRALVQGALVVGESGPELVRPDVQLKAMTLLGINAGFGNADCGTLPLSAVDLDKGIVDFPRPKTGIPRRCPLWPETVDAIREALAERPEPRQKGADGLAFLTARGSPWIHNTANGTRIDNVTIQFTRLLKKLGIHREGIGFYTLRHVFRTVADAARDPVAIDLIMGHTDPSMASHYRERIEDSRLRAVADHVRAWLFGKAPDDGPSIGPEASTTSMGTGKSHPSGPSDPPHESVDESGVASGAQTGVARPQLATPENASKTSEGSHGPQGSQINGPRLSVYDRPALRLFVG